MPVQTISNHNNKYNSPRKQVVNKGLGAIVDFYKQPLVEALKRLQKKGDTLKDISTHVFNGEVSPQAISQNYLKKGAK